MYTVYRVSNPFNVHYKPVIRKGQPVSFKTKKEAQKWLDENPPKTVANAKFEVRRTIKSVNEDW